MERITEKQLFNLVLCLNKEYKLPETYFSVDKKTINVGHLHLDACSGGFKLVQTVNKGGGITEITRHRHTKRELYYILDGIREFGFKVIRQ